MVDNELAAPVAKLLELGEPTYSRDFTWPDYRSYGIGPEHIPALIAIATDNDLIHLPDDHDPRGWGPIHAWRALGQLRAQEAILPLMRLFHEVRDNDWVIEEMPDVFAMIGSPAFSALADYLRDESYPTYSRLVAATSLMQIALVDPALREQSITVLAEQLGEFKKNSSGMNGVLIANLVELEAAEQADLIQRVFAEGSVDRFIVGDWRDIKNRLQNHNGKNPLSPGGSRAGNSLAKNLSSTPPDPAPRPAYQEPRTTPHRHSDAAR